MDRSPKEKINQKTAELKCTLGQLDQKTSSELSIQQLQNTFFPTACGTFSRIDHIAGHKSIFSDHKAVKLEIHKKNANHKYMEIK